MQAQQLRTLKPGTEFNALIPAADKQTKVIDKIAGVPETLQLVQKVVRTTLDQTEKLAPKLKGQDLDETLHNVWDFIYNYVQYHLDDPGVEQVRQPSRSWADRVRGVDCEDYSVFISSILLNLGIPHKLRISAYSGSWQHIYVIVPKDAADVEKAKLRRRDYYTVDPVTDAYDYEVPPTKTQDHPMQLTMLSGVSDESDMAGIKYTYLSESGHTMGIDGLGDLYVHDPHDELGDLEDLGGLEDIDLSGRQKKARKKGDFKPLAKAVKRAKINPKKRENAPVLAYTPALQELAGAATEEDELSGIEYTYLSESGHVMGIDGLGNLYVHDEANALGNLDDVAEADMAFAGLSGRARKAKSKGKFKPFEKAATKTPVNPTRVEGSPMQSHVEPNSPAPGEPEIVATYESESDHTIAIDGLGRLFVYDEIEPTLGELLDEGVDGLGAAKKKKGILKVVSKATKAVGKAAKATVKTAGKVGGAVVKVAAPLVSMAANVVPIPGAGLIAKGADALTKVQSSKAGQLVSTVSKASGKKKTVVKEVPSPVTTPAVVPAPAAVVATAKKPASKIKKPISLKPKAGKPVTKVAPKKKATAPVKKRPAPAVKKTSVQPVQRYAAAPVPAAAPVSVDTLQDESTPTPTPTVVTTSVVRPATANIAQTLAPFTQSLDASVIPMALDQDGSYSMASMAAADTASSPPALVPQTQQATPLYKNPAVIGGGLAALVLGAILLNRPTAPAAPAASARRPLSGLPAKKKKRKPSQNSAKGRKSGIQKFNL